MLNIIVAPAIIDKRGVRIVKSVVKHLKAEKVEYSVYFPRTIEEVSSTCDELRKMNETEFVIIGGDDMLSIIVNSISDLSKIKLGIIPTSNQDDFARSLELSSHAVQAIKDILDNHLVSVDYLMANERVVLNNISIGASAEVYEIFSKYKMKSALTEKYSLLKYGSKFEGVELSLAPKSGKHISETMFELNISNGKYVGGNLVSPLSNEYDGLMNINYATSLDKQFRKKYLCMFRKGGHIYEDDTKQLWLNSIKVTNPDNRIKVLLDKTIIVAEELDVRVIEGGLKIYKAK